MSSLTELREKVEPSEIDLVPLREAKRVMRSWNDNLPDEQGQSGSTARHPAAALS